MGNNWVIIIIIVEKGIHCFASFIAKFIAKGFMQRTDIWKVHRTVRTFHGLLLEDKLDQRHFPNMSIRLLFLLSLRTAFIHTYPPANESTKFGLLVPTPARGKKKPVGKMALWWQTVCASSLFYAISPSPTK